MSQLSELAALTNELATIVRQNRERIAELEKRVNELESAKQLRVNDYECQTFNPYGPIVVDLSGIDLK
jgi:hypothetical protein